MFLYFLKPNVEVGRMRAKPSQFRKQEQKTRKQIELETSDNNTRTRVSKSSTNSSRRQPPQSKKSATVPSCSASDEPMFIPADISDNSDWEWIAGGFPCRGVIRDRIISDEPKSYKTRYNHC